MEISKILGRTAEEIAGDLSKRLFGDEEDPRRVICFYELGEVLRILIQENRNIIRDYDLRRHSVFVASEAMTDEMARLKAENEQVHAENQELRSFLGMPGQVQIYQKSRRRKSYGKK